jgi:hypothetical protein
MKEERLVRDKQHRITRMLETNAERYITHWQKVGAEARAYVEDDGLN